MQAEQQRLAAQIEAENREAQRKIEEARLAAAREAERKRVEIENLNRIRQEAAAAAAALHEALQRQLREVERACDRGGGGGCTIISYLKNVIPLLTALQPKSPLPLSPPPPLAT
ncbi:hypothetical protein L218DRAFT_1003818 [Marasmius fiardii PR-910]|nr:hypothetical protein L218DRAFT_1003818 [Marasmius fiardii PR-910]